MSETRLITYKAARGDDYYLALASFFQMDFCQNAFRTVAKGYQVSGFKL